MTTFVAAGYFACTKYLTNSIHRVSKTFHPSERDRGFSTGPHIYCPASLTYSGYYLLRNLLSPTDSNIRAGGGTFWAEAASHCGALSKGIKQLASLFNNSLRSWRGWRDIASLRPSSRRRWEIASCVGSAARLFKTVYSTNKTWAWGHHRQTNLQELQCTIIWVLTTCARGHWCSLRKMCSS